MNYANLHCYPVSELVSVAFTMIIAICLLEFFLSPPFSLASIKTHNIFAELYNKPDKDKKIAQREAEFPP